jgi:hypothetical protein
VVFLKLTPAGKSTQRSSCDVGISLKKRAGKAMRILLKIKVVYEAVESGYY